MWDVGKGVSTVRCVDGVKRVGREKSLESTTQTLKDFDLEIHFASSRILLWQEVPLQL